MGIPKFYGQWLEKDVKQAIYNEMPPFVSSLAFDLNGVFHDARKQVMQDETADIRVLEAIASINPLQLEWEIHNAISDIILKMVNVVNPQDCLVLAVDGVAPGAKMQQQRSRREKASRDQSPGEKFDRNSVTPGTEFMINLDTFMIRFIGKNRDQLPPKVIYSSHLCPGEGEHKIMDLYRGKEISEGPIAKAGGVHILYGLDADLVMLSLMSPLNNIYLSRESQDKVVNIDGLKEYLLEKGKRESSIDDFVLMMFFIGNDFLPHMPSLEYLSESITLLLDIYSQGDYSLTKIIDGKKEINWSGLKMFLSDVSTREVELLTSLSTRSDNHPSRFFQASVRDDQFYFDSFRRAWYANALGPKGDPEFTNALEEIINKYVPDDYDLFIDPNYQEIEEESIPEKIENMSVDYLRTIAWTYLYYSEGTNSINQDWAYPYYHTPLLKDLTIVIQSIDEGSIIGYEVYEGMTTFTALHQLVAVLPLKSRELLPVELRSLFGSNSILRDLFPSNFIIEMDGKPLPFQKPGKSVKDNTHDGTAIIPLIDRQRIMDAVAQFPFTIERAKRWMPVEMEIFIRNEDDIRRLQIAEIGRQRHAEFEKNQSLLREKRKPKVGKGVYQGRNKHTPSATKETTVNPVRSSRGRGEISNFQNPYNSRKTPNTSSSNRGASSSNRGGFSSNRGGFSSNRGSSSSNRGASSSNRGGSLSLGRGTTPQLVQRVPTQPINTKIIKESPSIPLEGRTTGPIVSQTNVKAKTSPQQWIQKPNLM